MLLAVASPSPPAVPCCESIATTQPYGCTSLCRLPPVDCCMPSSLLSMPLLSNASIAALLHHVMMPLLPDSHSGLCCCMHLPPVVCHLSLPSVPLQWNPLTLISFCPVWLHYCQRTMTAVCCCGSASWLSCVIAITIDATAVQCLTAAFTVPCHNSKVPRQTMLAALCCCSCHWLIVACPCHCVRDTAKQHHYCCFQCVATR